MVILRSLRQLARKTNSGNFLLSASHSSITFPPFPSQFPSIITHTPSFFSRSSSRFLPHLSKWLIPSTGGPLFLSFPPWKLSQSATPLYFQSDVIIFPKVQPLNLLHKHRIPLNLGLRSVATVQNLPNDYSTKNVGGVVNWPNMISMSRLLSGPLLGWMIIHEMYVPAFIGLAVSGATDWLDGYVARKMGIDSVVGSYLDPLADKVLIGCVALAMVDKGLLHPELVGIIVLRDMALVGGAVYKRASDLDWKWASWFDFFNLDGTRPQKVEPLFVSKVNTVFQLVLVTAALLQPDFGTQETQLYITYLSWLVASTTVGSTAAYGAQHLKSRLISIRN